MKRQESAGATTKVQRRADRVQIFEECRDSGLGLAESREGKGRLSVTAIESGLAFHR